MTKTKALKNFINKFLGYEAEGNSVTSVLVNTTENAEGGSSGGDKIDFKYLYGAPGDVSRVVAVKQGRIVHVKFIGFTYNSSYTLNCSDGFMPFVHGDEEEDEYKQYGSLSLWCNVELYVDGSTRKSFALTKAGNDTISLTYKGNPADVNNKVISGDCMYIAKE